MGGKNQHINFTFPGYYMLLEFYLLLGKTWKGFTAAIFEKATQEKRIYFCIPGNAKLQSLKHF